jgi:hypothetical protein
MNGRLLSEFANFAKMMKTGAATFCSVRIFGSLLRDSIALAEELLCHIVPKLLERVGRHQSNKDLRRAKQRVLRVSFLGTRQVFEMTAS